jgi:hypothetical protein
MPLWPAVMEEYQATPPMNPTQHFILIGNRN